MMSQAVNGFALRLCQTGASAIRKAPAQVDDPLMTVKDLAAYLRVKTQTPYDWARNKCAPPIETYFRRERNIGCHTLPAQSAVCSTSHFGREDSPCML